MGNKYIYYFLFVIIQIIEGCSKRGQEKIHVDPLKLDTYTQDEIIDDIYTIDLRYPDSVVIGSVARLLFNGKRFFLYDQGQQTVFIFDDQGNYLSSLFKSGGGPGEYFMINDITLRSQDNGIAIANISANNILFYDNNGKYVGEKDIDESLYFQDFLCIDNSEMVFFVNGKSSIDKLKRYDIVYEKGEQLTYLLPRTSKVEIKLVNFVPYLFTNSTGGIFLHPPFSNEIYQIKRDTAILWKELDFGTRTIPEYFYSGIGNTDQFKRKLFEAGTYSCVYGAVMATNKYMVIPISNKDWKIHGNIWVSLKSDKVISTSNVKLNNGSFLSLYPRATFNDYFITLQGSIEDYVLEAEVKNYSKNKLTATFYRLK